MLNKLLSTLLILTLFLGLMPVESTAAMGGSALFFDVPDNWSTEALESAAANGLLTGYEGRIMPDSPLTRAQMAAIITRAFGAIEEGDISSYTDVKSTDWFAGSMAKAYKMGVMQGNAGKMDPNSNMTREQFFAVLARALRLEPAAALNGTFSDEGEISSWARGDVYTLVNAGYIKGSNGKLNPRANISRAEFAQIMHNIIKQYISRASEYTNAADGNIMVNVPGVTLKNIMVNGDLIVGDGVGEGNLKLDNVTVKGKLLVRGGGKNSVIINGGGVEENVIVAKVDGNIRISVDGGAEIDVIVIEDGKDEVIIEGDVGTIIVNVPNVRLIIRNAAVNRLDVDCNGASYITVAESGRISNVVIGSEAKGTTINVSGHAANIETSAPDSTISGDGSVGKVTVNAGANNTSVTTPETAITNKGASGVAAGGDKPVPQYGSATNNNDGSDIQTDSPAGSGGSGPSNGGGPSDTGGPSYVTVSAVSVGGMAIAGETLTANAIPLGASLIYQWQLNDSADGTYADISGATGNTYVLAAEDAGNWIRVKATGTGNYIGTVTSAAFGPIKSPHETALTMSAADVGVTEGEQFTMALTVRGNVAYEDRNNMVRFYGVIPDITGSAIEFRTIPDGDNPEIVTDETERGYIGADADDLVLAWGSAEGTPLSEIDISNTSPAALSFTAVINETGNYRVTFVSYDITGRKQLNSVNETVSITVADMQGLAIEGSVEVGGELTAAGIIPAYAPVTYQWLRNGVPIEGAAGKTYTITVADVGRYISVIASYGAESKTSEPTIMVTIGDGSAENPYAVATAEQLDGYVRANPNKHYVQIGEIDLNSYSNWDPLPLFSGVFDGNGYTISNLKIDRSEIDNVGLFSSLNGGELSNIKLEDVDVKGRHNVGGLAGSKYNGSTIRDSYVSGSVTGSNYVGGISGVSGTIDYSGGTINNSYANCSVTGYDYVGGIVGSSEDPINNSCASGSVTGNSHVGGLTGYLRDIIKNSYVTCSVSGDNTVGGLVGWYQNGGILYSYAVGRVTGSSETGGLVGDSPFACYTGYCYYDSETVGQTDIGKGEPRTSTQMKEGIAGSVIGGVSIYTEWNTDIWDFGNGDEYPVLKDVYGQGGNTSGVIISGKAVFGETLSVIGSIPAGPAVTYQWLRNGASIEGATGKTYTLRNNDIGRHISVRVSSVTETKTSNRTKMVSKGDGSAGNPYAVATAEQLNTFVRENGYECYEQIEDIDLSGYDNWEPLHEFSGEYDGKGHAISHLKINRPNEVYVGLFWMMSQGELRNISLEGVDVTGNSIAGGLVGGIHSYVFGVVNIKNSCVSGSVSGNCVGGLVGYIEANSERGTISNSYAYCEVSGNERVGGLVGSNSGYTIENSYAGGNVSGNKYVGGLMGYSDTGAAIYNCYATGEVTGTSNTGGLIGGYSGSITASYYDSTTTKQTDTGKGEPRTTGQMVKGTADSEVDGVQIYTGWSTDIWDFGDDDDYPVLKFD